MYVIFLILQISNASEISLRIPEVDIDKNCYSRDDFDSTETCLMVFSQKLTKEISSIVL